jgi:flagellar motor component MotA
MKLRLLITALRFVLSQIDPQMVKELIDDLIDKVEDRYAGQAVVMQACGMVRNVFSIPDDIGGDED